MHIALDAMGSDQGADELVAGAVKAVRQADLQVTVVGDKQQLSAALSSQNALGEVAVAGASEVVTMDDSPFDAIRKKRDSSMVVAFDMLKQGQVDAVVSAGNSGAVMVAAIRSLGRLPSVSRPGIAGVFPTLQNPVVMMDVGANVDCRPRHLFQFAVMASAFSSVMFGIERPRVGILSIGEEGAKGNQLVKSTRKILAASNLNFIGNVEGQDTFQGNVDVIVCDGFVGNVCLKLSEGLAEAVMAMLGDEIGQSAKAKLGYFLARDAFANFRKRVDYAEYGGAPLLGLNGTGIICHGRSNSTAIKNAIEVANNLVVNKVNNQILDMLKEHESVGADE